jgi:hypothetical protein
MLEFDVKQHLLTDFWLPTTSFSAAKVSNADEIDISGLKNKFNDHPLF